jgi:hypothetical protein
MINLSGLSNQVPVNQQAMIKKVQYITNVIFVYNL